MQAKFLQILLLLFCTTSTISAIPVVTSVSPLFGPAAGGTTVTISGSGFTGVTAVNFGSIPAAFVFNSDTSITVPAAPIGVVGNVHITVSVGIATSVQTRADLYTYQGSWRLVVADNGNDVAYVIDVSTTAVTGPLPIGNKALGIAITPDGATAYIACNGSSVATPIDMRTTSPLPNIPTGGGPQIMAIRPNGQTAYATDFAANAVTPIDVATNTPLPDIPIGGGMQPVGIAITPNNATAYVVDPHAVLRNKPEIFRSGSNTVIPLNLNTQISGTPIPVGNGPIIATITPDGKTVYVSNNGDNTITPIDTATNTPGPAIPTGLGPLGIAVTPNGKKLYAANSGTNTMTSIDVATNTIVTPAIALPGSPVLLAISPDSQTVYATTVQGGVVGNVIVAVDVPTDTLRTTFTAGPPAGGLVGIAITPDQAPVARFTSTPAATGSPTLFNASASVSPTGNILAYVWDFGDGSAPVITPLPITSHTYTSSGTFFVTLTVINTAGTSTTQVFTGQTMDNNGGPTATVTQPNNIPPQPPSNFIGRLLKNTFLNRSECDLVLQWQASPTSNVLFYRIYHNGVVVAEVQGLSVRFCFPPGQSTTGYEVAAVGPNNIESSRVTLTMESCS